MMLIQLLNNMYRQASNVRKHSTTPIVRVTVDANGKEQEEIVLCITNMPKAEGNEFARALIEIMNSKELNDSQLESITSLILNGHYIFATMCYMDYTRCSLDEARNFTHGLRESLIFEGRLLIK